RTEDVRKDIPAAASQSTGLLDEVDRAIVEELRLDGRRTYGSIAEAVGLSEAAVRQRVQKLRDGDVIRIVAVTDPRHAGYTSRAMIGIRTDGDARAVAEALAAVSSIDSVVVCAGSFDVLAELVCEDDDALLELVNGVVRRTPGVRETETFVYLRLAKQSPVWGTR